MIAVLAALVTAYLGLAMYHAAFDAIANGVLLVWLVAVGGLAVLAIAAQINWSFGLALVLLISFVTQLVWIFQIGGAFEGEPAQFWIEARSFAASLGEEDTTAALQHLHQSDHPSALSVYGLAAFAFNRNLSVIQGLTAAVWTLQTYLVWKIASEVSELKPRAFACALIFGLSPTLIVFGGLPSVEALFGLFVLAAFYVMLSHRNRGLTQSAFLSGALVALAFLARPAGVGYMLGVFAVLIIGFL
ncbi:MAG: hypothetical protein AAF684_09290, partial [Pseudomonadota bacterium]